MPTITWQTLIGAFRRFRVYRRQSGHYAIFKPRPSGG